MAITEAGMRGQGVKLSVYMCVRTCRGGGDSWQKLQWDSCSWKAVRITKQAAKTSSNKERVLYIIKKGPKMILELLWIRRGVVSARVSMRAGREGSQGTGDRRSWVYSHVPWPVWCWVVATEPIMFGCQTECGWKIVCSAVGMNDASILGGRDFTCMLQIAGINWIPQILP